MAIKNDSKQVKSKKYSTTQTATLVLFSIVLISAIIVLLWAVGVGEIKEVFAYFNLVQEQPPMWVEVPRIMTEFLLAPAIAFFLIAIIIIMNHISF